MRPFLRRLLGEPLLHFLVLAFAIFAAYGLLGRWKAEAPDRIAVTQGRVEQIGLLFAKTWQRPPTDAELKGLVDNYVKEEIYYREARKLGLDQDDEVVRRRMLLKMQLLSQSAADAAQPTDAELQAYLSAHPDQFETQASLAFQQVYFDPQKRGDKMGGDIAAAMSALTGSTPADATAFGDVTLLPPDMPLSSLDEISRNFGGEFAAAVDKVKPGAWAGPIASSFGQHIVRIWERKPGGLPALGEIRNTVAREWTDAKRKELDRQHFDDLLKRYDVVIETSAP